MNINDVLRKDFVRYLINDVCGHDIEIIKRQKCFVIRSKKEEERDIYRIILLMPNGYTANTLNQMNSHDEADFATIQIKGSVREDKNGLSKIKNCLLEASIPLNGSVSELNQPYLTFDLKEDLNPDLVKRVHSSATMPFTVVKNNGYGFYHNLINLTDEWLILKLHKKLRPQKDVNLSPYFKLLSKETTTIFENFYKSIQEYGDQIFKKAPKVLEDVLNLPLNLSLPILGEMLYVHDTGKHEACTVFATLLKIGKSHPDVFTAYFEYMKKEGQVPGYYAEQLIKKIEMQKYLKGLKEAV